MSKKKLAFSGVQPTGNLHLGNYLGALKNFVSLQNEMDCIYCIVDLHAITVFQKPSELHDNVLETTASFLATGLNPDKSIIFDHPQQEHALLYKEGYQLPSSLDKCINLH